MKGMLLVMLLLFSVPVFAETYKWIDDRGTVNFSENLGSVPKKYRKRVKIIGGDEANVPQVTEVEEPGKGKDKGDGKEDAKDAGKEWKKKAIYGGKDEAAWKYEFKKLKADITASEEQLADTNTRLSDSSKMSRSEYLTLQHTGKNIEYRLSELRKKLDSLNAAAAKAGVPAGSLE